jgi:toxin secretion/phage lysis holin
MINEKFLGFFMVIGAYISYLLGGWDVSISTLLTFMVIDFITGLILSAYFKKSLKTETGGLSSKVGFIGLFKKGLILVFVLVATKLDLLLQVNYIRDGVCIAFIINELISFIENVGLIGFPVPKIISDAIDILKSKADKGTQ